MPVSHHIEVDVSSMYFYVWLTIKIFRSGCLNDLPFDCFYR